VYALFQNAQTSFVDTMKSVLVTFLPELSPVFVEEDYKDAAINMIPRKLRALERSRGSLYNSIWTQIEDIFNTSTTEEERRAAWAALYNEEKFNFYSTAASYKNHMFDMGKILLHKCHKIFDELLFELRNETRFDSQGNETTVDIRANCANLAEDVSDRLRARVIVIIAWAILHIIPDPNNTFDGLFERVRWGKNGNGHEGWVDTDDKMDVTSVMNQPPVYHTPPPKDYVPLRERAPPETVRRKGTKEPVSRQNRDIPRRSLFGKKPE
jgi:hypothetical protein